MKGPGWYALQEKFLERGRWFWTKEGHSCMRTFTVMKVGYMVLGGSDNCEREVGPVVVCIHQQWCDIDERSYDACIVPALSFQCDFWMILHIWKIIRLCPLHYSRTVDKLMSNLSKKLLPESSSSLKRPYNLGKIDLFLNDFNLRFNADFVVLYCEM